MDSIHKSKRRLKRPSVSQAPLDLLQERENHEKLELFNLKPLEKNARDKMHFLSMHFLSYESEDYEDE